MNLKDKLLEKMILNPMQAQTKESAIQELLTHLESLNILSGTNQLYTNIQEQERHFTSSAGRGIAYPHSISIDIDKLVCILGISKDGIDFNSPDGQACHIILLTLSPLNDPHEHRKFITRFRTMISDPLIRSNIFDAEDEKKILKIISDWEDSMERNNDLV